MAQGRRGGTGSRRPPRPGGGARGRAPRVGPAGLGLPAVRGRGSLVAAMAGDSIGTGLFLPFAVLYFLHTTALPLTLIGGGLTAAYLVALPTPVAVGPLLDRFGPRRVIAAGNLLSVLAFTGYIFVGSLWQLILAALVASVGQATFWTATRALVVVVARPAERGSWFAMQTTIRNAGYGLGGILGAVAVSAGSRWAYLLLAAVNAASFLLAAALVLRWRPPAEVIRGRTGTTRRLRTRRPRGAATDICSGIGHWSW